jgi:5-methylcytosine-specific restriction endonuclease McrA
MEGGVRDFPDRYGCATWFLGNSTLGVGAAPKELKRAQRGCCYLCGRLVTLKYATFDHVVPKSRGGGSLANKLLAHKHCNGRKGNREPRPCELLYLRSINLKIAARRTSLGRPV